MSCCSTNTVNAVNVVGGGGRPGERKTSPLSKIKSANVGLKMKNFINFFEKVDKSLKSSSQGYALSQLILKCIPKILTPTDSGQDIADDWPVKIRLKDKSWNTLKPKLDCAFVRNIVSEKGKDKSDCLKISLMEHFPKKGYPPLGYTLTLKLDGNSFSANLTSEDDPSLKTSFQSLGTMEVGKASLIELEAVTMESENCLEARNPSEVYDNVACSYMSDKGLYMEVCLDRALQDNATANKIKNQIGITLITENVKLTRRSDDRTFTRTADGWKNSGEGPLVLTATRNNKAEWYLGFTSENFESMDYVGKNLLVHPASKQGNSVSGLPGVRQYVFMVNKDSKD